MACKRQCLAVFNSPGFMCSVLRILLFGHRSISRELDFIAPSKFSTSRKTKSSSSSRVSLWNEPAFNSISRVTSAVVNNSTYIRCFQRRILEVLLVSRQFASHGINWQIGALFLHVLLSRPCIAFFTDKTKRICIKTEDIYLRWSSNKNTTYRLNTHSGVVVLIIITTINPTLVSINSF